MLTSDTTKTIEKFIAAVIDDDGKIHPVFLHGDNELLVLTDGTDHCELADFVMFPTVEKAVTAVTAKLATDGKRKFQFFKVAVTPIIEATM